MRRYKYHREVIDLTPEGDERLDLLGAEGWQLVHVFSVGRGGRDLDGIVIEPSFYGLFISEETR